MQSLNLERRAEEFFPGGVNSPVRAFRAVGGNPPFVARAEGATLFDADGNRYVDLFGSWGPMILGHAFPPVVEAIREAAGRGTSFGASHAGEADLAELVRRCFPSVEKMRFVSSGTEACMSAIRLARGFTGRNFVVKFEGCYHGHADALLVKAGSGVATFGIPGSAGVPAETAQHTLALPYNNLAAVEAAFAAHPAQIACILVEPVVGNAGTIPPAPGYLAGLRQIATKHGALLIFDEVMTGFRLSLGGAQQLYNITPDLTTLGKILGGGLPCGAFGGRADVMDHARASRPRLPGRNAQRKSAGHGRRDRHAHPPHRARGRDLSAARTHDREDCGGSRRAGARGRSSADRQPRGLDVHLVLHRRPSDGLCLGQRIRHRRPLRASTGE